MADATTDQGHSNADRYRITGELGEGGMGEVFRGVHIELGREVAIKRLKKEVALDQSIVRRFFNEARAVNAIRHENIVEVTDLFSDDQGRAHMVMEYLEGHTLGDLMEAKAPLPPERVAHIGAQIADALAAAHEHEIVHRDVKPANVFLIHRKSTDDYVKLLDFGIARLQSSLGGIEATQSGQIVGTPIYMPPEQAKGHKVGPAADIYSLGVMLYEMLTGEFPFPKSSAVQMMMAHITDPPKPMQVPGLPEDFKALVERCLAKEPSGRPASAKEIVQELEQWAQETKNSDFSIPAVALSSSAHQSSAFEETWDSSNEDISVAVAQIPPPSECLPTPTPKPTSSSAKGLALMLAAAASALVLLWINSATESTLDAGTQASLKVDEEPVTAKLRREMDQMYLSQRFPAVPEGCRSYDTTLLAAHSRIAQGLAQGKPGSARGEEKEALALLTSLGDDISPESLFWRARANLVVGNLVPAIRNAKLAYQYCQGFAAAYALEGTAHAFADAPEMAILRLTKALELHNDYTDARFNLALSQLATDQVKEAIDNLTLVIATAPDTQGAHNLRGQAYLQYGDMKRSLQDLQLAVKATPKNAGAWYALSYAREGMGDSQGAQAAACKAKRFGHAKAQCDPTTNQSSEEWSLHENRTP